MITDLDVYSIANTRAISLGRVGSWPLAQTSTTLPYSPKAVAGSIKIMLPLLGLFVYYDASNHRS